jgi:predicted metal-dependent enzyme (double-stranded beta helix superfamily)
MRHVIVSSQVRWRLPPVLVQEIDMATIPVTYDSAGLPIAGAVPALPPRQRSALLEIEEAVKAEALLPHEGVARILELRVTDPDLLDGVRCVGSRDRYTRHLVYAGPGFSILALVWLPGQMSPIHSHRSWCVLGIRQGMLVETGFTLGGSAGVGGPRLTVDRCQPLLPGMVSSADADEGHYHRVANLGVETAVSIHVYGVAFDRLGHGLNRIWEDET